MTGPYRLPTEAEWEYAARAGTRTMRPWGDGESDACRHANVADQSSRRKYRWGLAFECDDGYAEAAPVGRFLANGFGLHDMLGNVLEWTQDCYVETYAGAPTDGTAMAGPNCKRRVVRGGSWIDRPDYVRSADRFGDSPVDRIDYVGFRVARTLP